MQQTSSFLLRGGLNLVTPPLAIPAGQAIASLNYAPDVGGYSRVGGYERFDGHPRPSDSSDPVVIADRRTAILEVPGTGPVRGVWVYAGEVYAFRDHADGSSRMYLATSDGWEEQTFGETLEFSSGTAEFAEGETLTGGTSGATATIKRIVLQSGAWSGTASGFLVLADVSGTFQVETITSTAGSATASGDAVPISLIGGGVYEFVNKNFYGAGKTVRMYGVNGSGYGFEYDGITLSPIKTGAAAGVLQTIDFVLAANGDFVLAANGDSVILRASFDTPTHIAHFKNHLLVGYPSGSVIVSSIGEPLEYITTTGAGELFVGEALTAMLSAATSMLFFCRGRIEYLVGNDTSDFVLSPITDSAGGIAGSVQLMASPTYLDDGGIRTLDTTAAFGDWRAGSQSELIEPLLRAKREAGIQVSASMRVKTKDQYRLFFDDGTGVNVYFGRRSPETMPFKLPITVFCACADETTEGLGDRLFVGATDGFVYELDRGLSFDGAAIPAYLRLAFNHIGSPTQKKAFRKITAEIDSPDDIEVGIVFDIDYARGQGSSQADVDVDAGTPTVSTADYGDIDWTQAVAGLLEHHIAGIGRNLAVTYITEAADKRSHTLASSTINFAPRGLAR